MAEQLKIYPFRKGGYVLVLERAAGTTDALVEFFPGGRVGDCNASAEVWERARKSGPEHLFLMAENLRELCARRVGGEHLHRVMSAFEPAPAAE